MAVKDKREGAGGGRKSSYHNPGLTPVKGDRARRIGWEELREQ